MKHIHLLRHYNKIVVLAVLVLAGITSVWGQASVSGPNCAIGGTTQSYTLFSASASGFTYTISNGTLAGGGTGGSGSGNTNINVVWTPGAGSGSILLNSSDGNASEPVTITTPLEPGTITNNQNQYISYNTVPQTISCPGATGQTCSPNYVYQWQQSPNNTSGFANIVGASAQDLSFSSALAPATYYYRRQVTETNSGVIGYSDTASLTAYPQLVTGSIMPSSQTVSYNTTPGTMSISGSTGGTGSYSYQWQSSSNSGGPYTNINFAFVSTYTPPALTTTTYYQVVTSSIGSPVTSTPAAVHVQPVAGNISSAGSTYNYGATPASLSISPVGGNGSYSYQWYSDGGGSYQPITGATGASYNPGALYASTDYYVVVTSDGMTSQSPTFTVTVYPQLITGTINAPVQEIAYNTAPSLSETGVTGGNGTYSYQWFSSTTSAGPWQQTSAVLTTNSFSPAALITATYFEVVTSSNGVSVTSAPAVVNVAPQLLAGTLSPSVITISSGASPGMLTCNMATGGDCGGSYSYSWQSSPDGSTWTTIAGVTGLTYNPGNVSTTTYYQVVVICGGQTAASNTALIQVGTVNTDWSFVRTRDITRPGITDTASASALTSPSDVKQVTQYVDGLGRPLQEVAMQASPLQNDMVTMHVYDTVGREAIRYMPYTSPSNSGNFKTDPFGEQSAFNTLQFPTDQYFYGQVDLEASPLNRPLVTYAPGNSWVGAGRGVGNQYLVNAISDSVHIWDISLASGSLPLDSGLYAAGQLAKTVTTDEQGHQVIEYKDKNGLVVLKKVREVNSPGTAHVGWLCTYYVYDDLNNLRFVIQPRAVELINTAGTWAIPQTIADELCFQYGYDYRNRMSLKKTPGAGQTWMVYDVRDLLVMTQDSNLRRAGQWLVTQYDSLDRPVETGLINYISTQATLQQQVTTQTAAGGAVVTPVADTTLDNGNITGDIRASHSITGENGFSTADGGTFIGEIVNGNWGSGASTSNSNSIALSPLPSGVTLQPLTITYYDDYSWVTGTGTALPSTFASSIAGSGSYFITSYNTLPSYAIQVTPLLVTRGQVTGTQTLVLGSSGQYLSTINFYDDRARLIQTESINYTGGLDTVTTQYDFTGKPLRTLLGQAKVTNTAQYHEVLTKTNYDPNFRVTSVYKNIDGASSDQMIDSMQYNELGQLRAKYLGKDSATGQPLDSLVYDYNVRGWVTGINKNYVAGTAQHYFGMELDYDNPTSVAGTSYLAPTYNGNIAGMVWKSAGDQVDRKYDFTYDSMNRLTGAAYLDNYSSSGWGKSHMDYTVDSLTYDANGNILSMNQHGYKLGNPTGLIDQLAYTYEFGGASNKLTQVQDAANDTASTLGDFHYRGAKADSDYRYDGNGNLTIDNNKGIDSIYYNYLNLPQQVHMKGEGNIYYTYDAAGNKLTKQTIDSAAGLATTTLYLDGFQYQRRTTLTNTTGGADTLQFVGHEQGRARWAFQNLGNGDSAYSWQYDFYERDHLGNTRIVLTQEQETDQYPAATMEASDSSVENLYYTNLDETRSTLPAGYPTDTTTNPNNYVAQVFNPGSAPAIGPGIVLKVMAGDHFSIRTSSWYRGGPPTPVQVPNVASDLVSALIAGVGHVPGEGATAAGMSSSPTLTPSVLNFFADTGNVAIDETRPHAFLNWILFDNQFNYVAASSGCLQVGASGPINQMAVANLLVTSSGFLYIYVNNASPNVPVFFDNLQVTHVRGPLLEEDHYYPFGLSMAGISDKAVKSEYAENKYRFNKGSELQNKEFADGSGLEMYETHYRELDPQLGRWWQVDPKPGDMISPYSSLDNNPILYFDELGDIVTTDEGSAERYNKLKAQNNADIQKLFGQIMISALSGSIGSKGLDRAVSLFNKEVDFRNALETLESSDITYHISSNSPGIDLATHRQLGGKTDYNETTKQIDVTIGSSGIDVLAHELTHAYQFEIGNAAFRQGKVLIDVSDEREAEANGYLFRGPGWQDFVVAGNVTNDYMINKRGYRDIPNASLTLNSTGKEIYNATGDTWYRNYPDKTARDIFKDRNQLLINSGKTIMFIYNDVLRVKK